LNARFLASWKSLLTSPVVQRMPLLVVEKLLGNWMVLKLNGDTVAAMIQKLLEHSPFLLRLV
jgi:hypothetical protein